MDVKDWGRDHTYISLVTITKFLLYSWVFTTAFADGALAPVDFPVAPALKAIPAALKKAGLEAKDIARWEINEVGSLAYFKSRMSTIP